MQPLKIHPTSATNRSLQLVATSAMLLNFDDSKHWMDI